MNNILKICELSEELEAKIKYFENNLPQFDIDRVNTNILFDNSNPSSGLVDNVSTEQFNSSSLSSHLFSLLNSITTCLIRLHESPGKLQSEVAVQTDYILSHDVAYRPLLNKCENFSLKTKLSTVSEGNHVKKSGTLPHTARRSNQHTKTTRNRRSFPPVTQPKTDDSIQTSITSFLTNVESALTVTNINYPGCTSGAPSTPDLDSIRCSREAYIYVWTEYYNLIKQPLPINIRAKLCKTDFNNYDWTDAQLLTFVRFFFTGEEENDPRLHLVHACNLQTAVLDTWLCVVYSRYNNVPFHNFHHAFMVAQMMYTTIRQGDLVNILSPLDLFILIFVAICHDLDHPGKNNLYQNNVNSNLSICYNLNSPLENHHCAVAFDMLAIPKINMFSGLTPDDTTFSKKLCMRCIMGTDMANHKSIVDNFNQKITEYSILLEQANSRTVSELMKIDEDMHAITMVSLLKMCDISTEIRPSPVSDIWLKRLFDEFSLQADVERSMGLPVSTFMDRALKNPIECQCSFLEYVLLPLAEAICSVLPSLKTTLLVTAQTQLAYYLELRSQQQIDSLSKEIEEKDDASNLCQTAPISCGTFDVQQPRIESDTKDFNDNQTSSPDLSCCLQEHSPLDTTIISSAGVSKFTHPLSSAGTHFRPLRRSLGEMPWPQNVYPRFTDLFVENGFLQVGSSNLSVSPPNAFLSSSSSPQPNCFRRRRMTDAGIINLSIPLPTASTTPHLPSNVSPSFTANV